MVPTIERGAKKPVPYYEYTFATPNVVTVQGKFFAHPGELGRHMSRQGDEYLEGPTTDDCDTSGCFFELSIQLMVVMTGKQLFNNIVELVIPSVAIRAGSEPS